MTTTKTPMSVGDVLRGLAERCEQATDFNRTLDADIAVALKLGCRSNLPDDLEYLSPLRPGDMGQPGGYWFHCRSGQSYCSALLYTHSIDAAMTLYMHVPNVISSCPRKVVADALRQRASLLGEGADRR